MSISDFETNLGYVFSDKSKLATALTHTSFANETYKEKSHLKSNERIEFVGDAVLGLIVGGYIYTNYPEMPEGMMSKLRASVVCEATLAELALKLEIDKYLRLGVGEKSSGGAHKASLLADAMESVIGAIYMEAGFDVARKIMLVHLEPEILKRVDEIADNDYKSRLQELLGHKKMTVSYSIIDEAGPQHARIFTAKGEIDGMPVATGIGKTKKEAEQMAAKALLAEIENR